MKPCCGVEHAETVRESDIEKLSFAVELADAFFGESQVPETETQQPVEQCVQNARVPAQTTCFAVFALANHFLATVQTCFVQEGARQQGLEAGNMLWLIQRDFLQVCLYQNVVCD